MKDVKDFKIDEIRKILLEAERKIRALDSKNELKKKYKTKITYMLFFLRVLPLKKGIINNWILPDYKTLVKREKRRGLI